MTLSPHALAVELASMLLLPGLIGAYHFGRQVRREQG
jgi:NADH:ubiquinone oxidoreductase subunit 6 (subunit J)